MRKALVATPVAAVLVGAFLALTPGVASAVEFNPDATLDPSQVSDRRCANQVCVFEHQDFGGAVVYYTTGSKDMSRYGPSFNDRTTSIRNWTGSRWCFYENPNYGGRSWYLDPMRQTRNVGSAANDVISSAKRC